VVAEVWRDVLKAPHLTRHANFFDQGGHSLLAVQVHRRLRERFPDRPLTITDLFRFPTVASLAPVLGSSPSAAPPVRRRRVTTRPEPLFFGDPTRPLFGLFHGTAADSPRDAVLLCYPMPPEDMLSHRAFQRLAASLAERGFDVLRFDYRGMGDSAGEPADACADRWTADTLLALAQLRERSEAASTSIVGLRLGAALASRAASDDGDIDRLVLWEPVLDGPRYLAEVERLAASFARAPRNGVSSSEVLDVRGFPLTRRFQETIQGIDVLSSPPRARRILVLESVRSPQAVALGAALVGMQHVIRPGLEEWARLLEEGNVLLPHASLTSIREFLADE
jgi:pimeloyl-ACP methyl ester carboxylesterase